MKSSQQKFSEFVDEITGQPDVWKAVFANDSDLLKDLIKENYDINACAIHGKFSGSTPFWLACHLGYVQCVEILLEAGADVNACQNQADYIGKSPIWYLAHHNCSIFMQELVAAKADVNSIALSGEKVEYFSWFLFSKPL
jgi:ankyrin repeat protein